MWFLFAFTGAVFKAFTSFFRKKIAGNVSAATYMWVNFSVFLLVLTPLVFSTDTSFVNLLVHAPLLVLGASITSIVAILFTIEALKREELSYIAPLNAFIPIFTLILAGIFLHENPPVAGIFGILSIVSGAYVMNLQMGRVHWYEPIAHAFKSTGARFGMGVAVCFSINAVLIKAMTSSGYGSLAIMYATTIVGWLLLIHVPVLKRNDIKRALASRKGILLGAAFSSLLGIFFNLLAIEHTYASYALGVRRFDIVISVLLGWRLLKETNFRNRLFGSIFMVIGAILLAVS